MSTSSPSVASIPSSTECTECAGAVRIERTPLCGEILRCTHCHSELEVVSVEPLRIELAPEVEEDWGE